MDMVEGEGGQMEHYAKKMLFKGFVVGALVGSAITIHAIMHMAFQMGMMGKEGKHMMGPWGEHMEEMRAHARRKMMMMREHWMGHRGCCGEEEEEEVKPEEQPEEPKPETM